jgi:hypothetical protein
MRIREERTTDDREGYQSFFFIRRVKIDKKGNLGKGETFGNLRKFAKKHTETFENYIETYENFVKIIVKRIEI